MNEMTPTPSGQRQHLSPAGVLLAGWCILSLLVAASLLGVYAWKGPPGLDTILVTGPYSKFALTFMSLGLMWLLAGLAFWQLATRRIYAGNIFTWVGFFLVSVVYINLLRERLEYGDLAAYVLGASNLYHGEPFDSLYIYPPFWAMLLKPLVPLGDEAILNVLWLLNLLSLMAFYFLLHRLLERYGFGSRLAALVVTLFMLANVSILRTMFYMQINLHVLNLILLSILLYPRSRLLSAFLLALAVHLKASPLVLVLAFLLERDWRWLAWLGFFGFFIFEVTLLNDGIQPYASYLHNLSLLNEPRGLILRDTSFDSFFWALAQLAHLPPVLAHIGIYLAKGALAVASLFVMWRAVRNRSFYAGNAARLLNALPPLFILMNMTSPLVWEHHGVFLVLPALLLLCRLSTPSAWSWFGAFYLIQFLLPTFDFFPWSYLRMLTPLVLLWLLWRASAFTQGATPLFQRVNQWLETLPELPVSS